MVAETCEQTVFTGSSNGRVAGRWSGRCSSSVAVTAAVGVTNRQREWRKWKSGALFPCFRRICPSFNCLDRLPFPLGMIDAGRGRCSLLDAPRWPCLSRAGRSWRVFFFFLPFFLHFFWGLTLSSPLHAPPESGWSDRHDIDNHKWRRSSSAT